MAEEKAVEEKTTEENVIYVGNKTPMSYVLAVVTQFNGGSKEVVIRNRFVTDAKVKDIKIGTESITNEEGRTSNVSTIEIVLSK